VKKNSVITSIISGVFVLAVAAASLYSCSGGGSGSGSAQTGSVGTVALYATDDMSDHKQVVATINRVTVVSTGSGTTCDVLTTPVTINIANLSSVLQLLNTANCPAVPYNRLHIEFNKTVELMDQAGIQSACSFTSYKDEINRPNRLQCSGDTCSLDINGAINVFVNRTNLLGLDFNLKDFDVGHFGTPQCSVTMKVSPLHGAGFRKPGYREGITGLVSMLTTSTRTFDLTKGHMSFPVLYSGITSTRQPGLDDLLLRAQQDGLRTRVTASTLDYANRTIVASDILVKTEGLISALTASAFTVTYHSGKTMNVDYSRAVVKGTLTNDAWAEIKLFGFDGTNSDFLAAVVEIEHACTVPMNQREAINTED
jgi:hypothetical protein